MRFLRSLAGAALFVASAFSTPAQHLGDVSIATVQATVASNATCTGTPQNFTTDGTITNFNNIGQTSHLATATSNAVSFQMEIDGIDNLGNVFRLSDLQLGIPTSAKGGLVVTASGYMPKIRIAVTCTAAATFSISYSGSFSPQPPNIAGSLLAAIDKLPFQTAPANTTASITFQSPTGNSQGTIVFQYAAAGPSGSSVSVSCLSNAGTALQSFTFSLATPNTAQLFQVQASTCPFVTLTYTSGGASATTYTLEYAFTTNGNTSVAPVSSATPLQTASNQQGTAYIGSVSNGGVVNPASGASLLNIFLPTNSPRSLYFDHAVVSCTAACTIEVSFTTSTGTTCTTVVPTALRQINSPVSIATATSACTGQPALSGGFFGVYLIPAGQSLTIDLRGIIQNNTPGSGGLAIAMAAALTGTAFAQTFWWEQ